MSENRDNIEHLDFEPSDETQAAIEATEAAKRIMADPRDYNEAVNDEIDNALADKFHAIGLMEADDSSSYSREQMLEIAHLAYFQAVRDSVERPEVLTAILKAAAKNGPGLKVLRPNKHE